MSPVDMIVLFNAASTDISSTAANFSYPNGKACIKAFGTWNGATITINVAAPTSILASTWIPLKDKNGNAVSFSANGLAFIEDMVYDDQIQAVITSAGGSTSVSCTLQPSN